MKDQLITFETAVLAKEKGFKLAITTYKRYTKKGVLKNWGYNDNPYLAPTQALLQKWLREKHKIQAYAFSATRTRKVFIDFIYVVNKFNNSVLTIDNRDGFSSYEIALEKGLQEALKLIKS